MKNIVQRLFVSIILCLSFSCFAHCGIIPSEAAIKSALQNAYGQFKDVKDGKNADYIPALAKVDPELFGISITTVDGKTYEIGDINAYFSMQSVSKVFVLAMALQEHGEKAMLQKIGVGSTGQKFNSVMAIELTQSRTGNPFVNAGAMATTSLIKGKNYARKWNDILANFAGYAGQDLSIDPEVYKSELATNQHNQAIAMLLHSYGRFYSDPKESVDLYTKQCAVKVTTHDLSVMGATLANGGVNPLTSKKMLDEKYVPKVLAMMAADGLYETSGFWLFKTGVPAKSGVGGAILAVVPGQFGIAAFSPRLDDAGNSIRAQLAITSIIADLNANLFAR